MLRNPQQDMARRNAMLQMQQQQQQGGIGPSDRLMQNTMPPVQPPVQRPLPPQRIPNGPAPMQRGPMNPYARRPQQGIGPRPQMQQRQMQPPPQMMY